MGTLLITYKRETFTFQDVRKEYEEIKRDIDRRSHDDSKIYVKIKEQECRSFVEKVLAGT